MTRRLEGRWWCPSCDRLFKKSEAFDVDGNRYHSHRCQEPMQPALVTIKGDA